MPVIFSRGSLYNTFARQVPLIRLSYQNKTSYLFGSCHTAPLKFSPKLQQFLVDHKTLIVESYKKDVSFTSENWRNFISENDSQARILQYHQFKQDINIAKYKKYYVRHIYHLNLLPWLKQDPFYKTMEQITQIELYKNIFKTTNDINLSYLSRMIYINMCIPGIDNNLVATYQINDKPIYGLDELTYTDDEFSKSYSKPIDKFLKKLFLYNFVVSKCTNKNIIKCYEKILDDTNKLYLNSDIFNDENIKKYNILVHERNRDWIPLILKCHSNFQSPLFVVGAAHLPDLQQKLTNEGYDCTLMNLQ